MNYKIVILIIVSILSILCIICIYTSPYHKKIIEHIHSDHNKFFKYSHPGVGPEDKITIVKGNVSTSLKKGSNRKRSLIVNDVSKRLMGMWKDDDGMLYKIEPKTFLYDMNISDQCKETLDKTCNTLKGRGSSCVNCVKAYEGEIGQAGCFDPTVTTGDKSLTNYVSNFCDETIQLSIISNIQMVNDISQFKKLADEKDKPDDYQTIFNGKIILNNTNIMPTIKFNQLVSAKLCTGGNVYGKIECSKLKERLNFSDNNSDIIIWNDTGKTKWYKTLDTVYNLNDYELKKKMDLGSEIKQNNPSNNIKRGIDIFDIDLKCGQHCFDDTNCNTFTYNQKTKNCTFYGYNWNSDNRDISKLADNTGGFYNDINLYLKHK